MESLLVFIEIVFINVLLSGDNAVVIALASQQLPPKQRKKAVWWGAGVAVGLRCLLTVAAITLLKIPFLQAVGAVLLFLIAVKLVTDAASHRGGESHQVGRVSTLAGAVRTIVAADFIMSLDNVLAIAAVAEGEPILMLLGIALSIPMIIWGSQLLGSLLHRFPSFAYLGGGLLGYAAGEMLAHDPGIVQLGVSGMHTLQQAIPLFCVPLVIIVALLRARR
ncbi:TerC family protein [Paenibacillus humicola]|uniref:TerC family protein n=1 Tax=Paenibacillus humicola TaxID=3110540 RepID=UPI00237A51D6|nr:TerC family protein [Paenibacillus humicola]